MKSIAILSNTTYKKENNTIYIRNNKKTQNICLVNVFYIMAKIITIHLSSHNHTFQSLYYHNVINKSISS